MKRRELGWFVATAVLALLVAATAPAFPMVQGDTDPEPPQGAEAAEGAGAEAAKDSVETILQQQEQLLRGQRFTYDPGNRRDPFMSLYDVVREGDGPRPAGIEGMTIEEIDLTGIVQDAEGDLAYFTGSDNKGYFLRVGQRIYKATMIAIDTKAGSVTFREQVDDPRRIKPYRDVVRKLVPVGEESGNE
jgi:hypothetical protein